MTPEELQQCHDCLPPDAELRRAWPYRAIVLLLKELEIQELLVTALTGAWTEACVELTTALKQNERPH